MNSLTKQYLIKSENLSEAHYFQSFLQEACRLNLLKRSELEDIEMQCLQFLAKQTNRYTFGDSSSVKIETAQGILESIFYTMGIYLKSFQDIDAALEELKQSPVTLLYQKGRKLIEAKFKDAGIMLSSIQNHCMFTENIAYNETIKTGIPIFFDKYDADFAAQDSPGSIDYPLCNDKYDLTGIEYLYNYLQKLDLENEFCRNFSEQDITNLLQGFNEQYQDLLIDIFQLVLTNAIGLVLLNKNVLKLDITPSYLNKLKLKFVNLSKDQINSVLQEASLKLISELNISNKHLQNYILDALMNITVGIKTASENNALESVFINSKENIGKNNLKFEEGPKLDDELFRKITEEIRECRFVSDKTAIIKRKIHSISDLTDVFVADCIFNEEFDEIFRCFGNMELALLTKKLPASPIASDLHLTESENEWQNRLICFLNEIDLDKKERIKALAEKINLE